MGSKKGRKYNYGYSESKFYRGGPMPYWPKKKRLRNKEEKNSILIQTDKTVEHHKLKQEIYIPTVEQIQIIQNYLEEKGSLNIQTPIEEIYQILKEETPKHLLKNRTWRKNITNSNHWNTNLTLKRVKQNNILVFEEILEI